MKLNLGCGSLDSPFRKKGKDWVNVDKDKSYFPDVVCDLEKKWVWDDGAVSFIYGKAIVEHLDYDHFFKEAHRVLIDGGEVEIIVPHYTYPDAYFPTHKNYFSAGFFIKGFRYHSGYNWGFVVKECELIFSNNKTIQRILGYIPNKKPYLWEQLGGRAVAVRVVLKKM